MARMAGSAGLLFVVDLDETAFVLLDFGVFQAEILRAGHAADGNQHAIEEFLLLDLVRPRGDDADFFALGGHLGDFGVEAQFAEILLRVLHDGADQIGIGAGEDAGQRLDDDDLAAEVGINGAQFHADVTAADDQQILGDFLDFQRLGGGHDARVAQVKGLGQRGLGTDGDDGLVKCDELLALGRFHAQRLRAFKIAAARQDLDAALFGQETRRRRQVCRRWNFSRRAICPTRFAAART